MNALPISAIPLPNPVIPVIYTAIAIPNPALAAKNSSAALPKRTIPAHSPHPTLQSPHPLENSQPSYTMKATNILLISLLPLSSVAQEVPAGIQNANPLEISKDAREKIVKLIEAKGLVKELEDSARKDRVEAIQLDKGVLIGIADNKEDQEEMREFLGNIQNGKIGDLLGVLEAAQGGKLLPDLVEKELQKLREEIAILTAEVGILRNQNAVLISREAQLNAKLAKAETSITSLLKIIDRLTNEAEEDASQPSPAAQ